ncbi:putative myosin heavy chain MYA2-related [Trypanosoma theileri]|uniref:Putative myosin heavy chain MYA2-related n=1 Tax=Trypanosoma theileri TaxID=67003 RepID=A0A1X0NTN9_9TRYP|nr:putative myosin heavy chain MYA2-related [Trypanosoma theileri]ORC87480.1 putative myosin heavy chain MYA2-related [Trypanosoma theileri]
MERVVLNQQVYYHHPQKGWMRGVVVAVLDAEKKTTVEDNVTGKRETVPSSDIHGYMEQAFDAEDPDLFHLSDLHVATTLFCIKQRFEELKQQYSLMGEMVLSVNPFQIMAFNSDKHRELYLNSLEPHLLPPHIWQVAHKAYSQIVLRGLGNQSVVISGESGSGKTENAKMLIAYLGQISYMHSSNTMQKSVADKVAESLKWSNPVLESFGNARTVRNDNSSRFGKYIKLYFDTSSGVMVGGETVTYLLEKSRILLQSEGERNYHIFYEMLAGLTPDEKRELGGLKTAEDYKCLSGGKTFTRRGVDGKQLNDAREFQNVRYALNAIGVKPAVQKSIFKVLASILHLLELRFETDQNDKAEIVDEGPFLTACELLQVDQELLRECFLVKSRSTLVTIYANKAEAEGLRGAFCKAIYVGLFDRLVEFVNKSIEPQGDVSGCKYIGLLDIFGFENFKRNSFEQICINYANESLQNHYNKYTFINDEEECKREGIQIPKIVFPDNSECVNMFDQKKGGIFAMLDEECHFKGGTSEHFTHNLWDIWANKNKYFVQPKSTVPNQFGVNHYAALVNYNTEEWLEKNTDRVKEEAYQCILKSGDEFIRTLMPENVMADRRKQTVALRFQQQLAALRVELESTETQFIRCIKPNMEARSDILENDLVGSQLESAGVLQTIALKRQGYPVRRLIETFCRYFYLIAFRSTVKLYKAGNFHAAAENLLSSYQKLYNWKTPNYAVGRTKVFVRAEVWASLERLLLRRKGWLMRRCIPFLLRWVYAYREAKRIAEERRREELRLAKEERERRASEIAETGITAEHLEWVETLATLFPMMDISTLIDVVLYLPKREESLAAVADMQRQCVDGALPSTFMRIMTEAEVRPSAIESLVRDGVTTVEKLSQCDQATLKHHGMTDAEVAAVTHKMLREQSQRVKLERLQSTIGKVNLHAAVEEAKHGVMMQADFSSKLNKLVELGYPRKHAVLALTHYSGDVQKAAARLLQGGVAKHIGEKPPNGKNGKWTSLDEQVQQIVKLGVSKENAKRALRRTSGNVDEAVRLIFPPAS